MKILQCRTLAAGVTGMTWDLRERSVIEIDAPSTIMQEQYTVNFWNTDDILKHFIFWDLRERENNRARDRCSFNHHGGIIFYTFLEYW